MEVSHQGEPLFKIFKRISLLDFSLGTSIVVTILQRHRRQRLLSMPTVPR